MLETYLEFLSEGYYEVGFAFDGLADENVWKRPAEGLLSIGEIAGHIAFWEAVKYAGGSRGGLENPDPAKCPVKSLLIDTRFKYYPTTLANPPTPEHVALTAKQVCSELLRVHNESMEHLKALNPDLDTCPPGWEPHYTYRTLLKYASFHVAYHTGQIYTARHLLGEKTPDN
jgi:hypothetical protein